MIQLEGKLKIWWYGTEESFIIDDDESEFGPSLNNALEAYEGHRVRVTIEKVPPE